MQVTQVSNRVVVRDASHNDLHDVIYIGKKFALEAGYSRLKVDTEKAEATFWSALEREDMLLQVLEFEGQVVGVFCGMVAPAFFTSELIGIELMWYLLPEYRGKVGSEALQMVDNYEIWAKERGACMVNMVNIDMLNGDKVASIYKKRGYTLQENTFIKEI